MINESVITKEYEDIKELCKTCLKDLEKDTRVFFLEKHPTTDIFSVYGRVKDLSSVVGKLKRYNKETMADIDDLVGVTVVCHCRSDSDRAMVVLGDYLPTKYQEVKSASKESLDGYKAHHFNFYVNVGGKNIASEIQVKTILQDAWGIQSHKYLYKKPKEGDADILARTMSGIFDNCENLWELVKKSTQASDTEKNILPIANEVAKKIGELEGKAQPQKVITGSFAERSLSLFRSYSQADKADLEEILDNETKKIKDQWLQAHKGITDIESAKELLGKTELSIKDLTVLGLYAIKYERIDFLKKILERFSEISGASVSEAGLVVSLSIPSAVLHNMYYYFGAYALSKKKTEVLALLINFQMEVTTSSGSYNLIYIWSNARIIAPEILHGANMTFDRLRNNYSNEDERVRTLIETDLEKFTTLALQFNFLFCIRGEQLLESKDSSHIWNYPNFGRFYGFRITPLLNRILKNPDYSNFVEDIFKVKVPEFNIKINVWLSKISKRGLGGGFWWESIDNIE